MWDARQFEHFGRGDARQLEHLGVNLEGMTVDRASGELEAFWTSLGVDCQWECNNH
jgi:hypothetical protein